MEPLIQRLNEAGVRYLLIGGQAMRLEGMPRFSLDWDLYVPAQDYTNLELINRTLEEELDIPLLPLGPQGENFIQTYQTRFGILQFHLGGIGLPPFDEAEKRKVVRYLEDGTPVPCLSGPDLLMAKQAANRPQDQSDILFLKEKYRLP